MTISLKSDNLCTWPSGQHKMGQNGHCSRCGYEMSVSPVKADIGPVRPERPFYVHKCVCGVVIGMSDMLFSPAAVQNAPCIGCIGKTDIHDETDIPGAFFTYGMDETDIADYCRIHGIARCTICL